MTKGAPQFRAPFLFASTGFIAFNSLLERHELPPRRGCGVTFFPAQTLQLEDSRASRTTRFLLLEFLKMRGRLCGSFRSCRAAVRPSRVARLCQRSRRL